MKFYRYFSDCIESEIELPELVADQTAVQSSGFLFRLSEDTAPSFPDDGRVHHWRLPADNSITLSFCRNKKHFLLDFPGIARFSIGCTDKVITGYPLAGTDHSTMRHLLLDQVLPRLFAHYFNYSILHASSVEVDGRSICFLGDTGWGKSTLATAFAKAGFRLLTDDCIRISCDNGLLSSIAGYNSIRLLPDSIEALDVADKDQTEPTAHYSAKRRFLQADKPVPLPVAAIFLLSHPNQCRDDNQAKIEIIPKPEAIIELLKNSFCLDLHDNRFLKQQFSKISAITTSGVPIYHLCYPRTFAKLPATVRTILQVLEKQPPQL